MSYYDEINARSQVPLSILSGHGAICVACAEVDALRLALAASRDEAEKAKADSARLDWLEGHVHHTHLDAAQESCYLIQHWDEKSARAAIDAARADAARKEQT